MRHGSPAQLGQLSLGLQLLHRGSILALGMVAMLLVAFIFNNLRSPAGFMPSFQNVFNIAAFTIAAWGVVVLVGMMLITMPNHQIDANARNESRVARIVLPLGPVVALIWLAILFMAVKLPWLTEAAHVVCFVSLWGFYLMLDRWLRRIEARIGPSGESPRRWPFRTRWWKLIVVIVAAILTLPAAHREESHRSARRARHIGPILIVIFTALLRYQNGPAAMGFLFLIILFPIMVMLTLGGLLRGVRNEIALAQLPDAVNPL